MATFELVDSNSDFAVIPDGEILTAEVVSCDTQTKPWKDDAGNDIVKVVFRFVITDDGEFNGRQVFGETPTTFSNNPDCKLRAWVKELLAQDDLPVGFKFNTESLMGLNARIVVAQREGKAADGSPKIRNYVQDVIRASTAATASDVF